jgi:hypothetical protein
MFRYKLRTLLIVLALGPPVLAFFLPQLLVPWLAGPAAADIKCHGGRLVTAYHWAGLTVEVETDLFSEPAKVPPCHPNN